jgi:hypothetical protein
MKDVKREGAFFNRDRGFGCCPKDNRCFKGGFGREGGVRIGSVYITRSGWYGCLCKCLSK